MKSLTTFGIIMCLVAGMLALAPSAQADQWNKRTIMTINETIEIPGATLTPGKYVFKLLDSPSNRHIVQVFNEDESQLINTILAIPNERLRPTGKTEFGFWEMPQGSAPALRSWFYPGDNFGQEFAYPESTVPKVASTEKVPTLSDEEQANLSKGTTSEASTDVAVNQPSPAPEAAPAVTPPETPAVEPQPVQDQSRAGASSVDTTSTTAVQETTEVAQNQPDRSSTVDRESRLPSTASGLPLLGLMGFLSVGVGYLIRFLRQWLS